jgi:glutamate racemase
MAEEGRTHDRIAELVVADYLRGLRREVHTVVLGCTHFPLFADLFARRLAGRVRVVDSAQTTAAAVSAALDRSGLRCKGAGASTDVPMRFLATDGIERFRRLGAVFLGEPVDAVELVDL